MGKINVTHTQKHTTKNKLCAYTVWCTVRGKNKQSIYQIYTENDGCIVGLPALTADKDYLGHISTLVQYYIGPGRFLFDCRKAFEEPKLVV